MGQCFSCVPCFQASSSSERDRSVTKVALKLPHGLKGMEYDAYKKRFVGCHIQEWLARLYRDATWTNWVTYNDQNHLGLSKKGHCKGIVAWNETRVSWLCHSVPHFPREFNGTTLSDIEPSEHLYGQSFHYYECDRTPDLVRSIFHQLYTMDACPILQRYTEGRTWDSERVTFKKEGAFTTLALGETMFHLSKSPAGEIDVYSQFLVVHFPTEWKVETWIRGHLITIPCPLVHDIDTLCYESQTYQESQDHSKWAVSDKEWYWVGDLNRMTSQFHRGGGGFVGTDTGIANAFRNLIQRLK